jgi:seryl-tRNA synthetase
MDEEIEFEQELGAESFEDAPPKKKYPYPYPYKPAGSSKQMEKMMAEVEMLKKMVKELTEKIASDQALAKKQVDEEVDKTKKCLAEDMKNTVATLSKEIEDYKKKSEEVSKRVEELSSKPAPTTTEQVETAVNKREKLLAELSAVPTSELIVYAHKRGLKWKGDSNE